MFFNKKINKKSKKTSRSENTTDIDNYEIVDETKNYEVTRAIFGKEPSDEIYSKRIYSAPHMIVAGTTGSGKSVNVNSLLGSMMLTATPKQLRFIIIDPKAVEFSAYNDSPYMITNPITDMDKASKALKWLVNLMQERYDMMRRMGEKGLEVPKNIEEYNAMVKNREEEEMYYTVAVVDEFSDLIGEHPEVEGYVVRIAQKARACGISLIIATQSPRSNVITGLIKANIPTRVCMMVVSSLESNIILDESGGELLRPHGDMLIKLNGFSELVRCQGPYISNTSIKNLIEFSKKHYSYLNKPIDIFENMEDDEEEDMSPMGRRRSRTPRTPSRPIMAGKETRKNDVAEASSNVALEGERLFDKPNSDRTEEEKKESKQQTIDEIKEEHKQNEENKQKEKENEKSEQEETIKEEPKEVSSSIRHEENKNDIKKANYEKVKAFNQRKKMLKTRNMVNKTKENAEYLMSDYAMRKHYQSQKEKQQKNISMIKEAMMNTKEKEKKEENNNTSQYIKKEENNNTSQYIKKEENNQPVIKQQSKNDAKENDNPFSEVKSEADFQQ